MIQTEVTAADLVKHGSYSNAASAKLKSMRSVFQTLASYGIVVEDDEIRITLSRLQDSLSASLTGDKVMIEAPNGTAS